MKEICTPKKEYLDFNIMYSDCKNIVQSLSEKYSNLNLADVIKLIRISYDKDILNSFYNIGNLPEYVANSVKSRSVVLKISMDSLLKNVIEHPEIGIIEYKNIAEYLHNADYIFLKNEKNLIYFKIEDSIYQFVIKNTKDGLENYITTFHKASIKQLEKDIKRYKQIKR